MVELTKHSVKRILERTRMPIEDVQVRILAGCAVDLGTKRKTQFLLFYSPLDRCSKIALVRGAKVVSVFNDTFRLPKGIKITQENEQEARRRLHLFLSERRQESERCQERLIPPSSKRKSQS